ncbi:MAG TPA: hemerythrin domain-containing protein [Burkholderiaceae bacterium]|nr:hemerythrin domain-containing protein [Burkholderiaceae bacterium]
MSFMRQVSHALDEEHRSNLDLLGRVEQALGRMRPGAAADPELNRLIAAFARHVEQDISRHFDFEERELFPRMAEAGDGEMASLLEEEHEAIRAVATELLPLASAAAAGSLDAPGWDALKRGSLEMVERQVAHIQKETMALLPLLDDLLDEETDRELAFAYATA